MISNSLPFLPIIITDYSRGIGYGKLIVTIDGFDAFEEGTKELAEDPADDFTINGMVTIQVTYD